MVQPILFGRSGKQLFGAYHPPQARRATEAGVLLCYPLVQEYNRSHWAFRKLARLLARQGCHVLRFDYLGTGDSAGESGDGGVGQWCEDIRTAAAELRDLGGLRRISIAGLRFGASLAALAVAGGLEVRELLLWEPALDGRSHLRELEGIQASIHAALRHAPAVGPEELLEYPLPPALRAGVEAVDLTALPRCAAERIRIFASRERPEDALLEAALRDRWSRPPLRQLVADEAGDREQGLVLSTRVLQVMAAALDGEGPP